MCYYAVGYSFAYGEPGNAFIGHNYFFASNVRPAAINETVVGLMGLLSARKDMLCLKVKRVFVWLAV